MSSQTVLAADDAGPVPDIPEVPGIALPSDFRIHSVDAKLLSKPVATHAVASAVTPPSTSNLGPLALLKGDFVGPGMNTIFRPQNTKSTQPGLNKNSDNVLEINLTREFWNFTPRGLGSIPNRGLFNQADIFLGGIAYTQTVQDVTDVATGKPSLKGDEIHFEPGLFLNVPATDNPASGPTMARLASIPHGTTINAQGSAPITVQGGPLFDKTPASTSPFGANDPNKTPIPFTSLDPTVPSDVRLPPDLSTFVAAGTITKGILANPVLALENANKGKNITETVVFFLSTASPTAQPTPARSAAIQAAQELQAAAQQLAGQASTAQQAAALNAAADKLLAEPVSNTADIAFLDGTLGNQNASAVLATSVFWIETVLYDVEVQAWPRGKSQLIKPTGFPEPVPTFVVKANHDVKAQTIKGVSSIQMQYTQTIFLNFAGLSWPHVSVASVVPTAPIDISSHLQL